MENWLSRTENLIGTEAIENLKNSNIAMVGIGGVGSFCAEALARSGINNITLIDNDTIDVTNINRQIMADTTTIGKLKVDVMKERILKINPTATMSTHSTFLNEENISEIITNNFDYVIDCIDSIKSKLSLIEHCAINNIKIISAMGTGNKLDPTKFEVTDISKTSVCPLAKIIRKSLREKNITKLKVVYSKEEPIKNDTNASPSSIAFVPSVAGLIMAGEVIKDLI